MDLDVSKFSYKISFTDLRRVGFKLDSGKVFEAVKGDARLVALQLLMETSRKAKYQFQYFQNVYQFSNFNGDIWKEAKYHLFLISYYNMFKKYPTFHDS